MIPLREDNTSALGFINDLINNKDVNKLFGKKAPSSKEAYLKGSISNYTKDLIMTFPCMCDNAIPISTASLISKANERYIITMLEMLFASAQMHGDTGADVIASIHSNLKSNFNIDDYLDALDNYVGECKEPSKMEIATALREMVLELKKPMQVFPTNSFSESSVYDYDIYKRKGEMSIQKVQEATNTTTNTTKYYYTYADYQKDMDDLAKYGVDNSADALKVRQIVAQRDMDIAQCDADFRKSIDTLLQKYNGNSISADYNVERIKLYNKYTEERNQINNKYEGDINQYRNSNEYLRLQKEIEYNEKLHRYNNAILSKDGKIIIGYEPNEANRINTSVQKSELDELEKRFQKGQIDKQELEIQLAKIKDQREEEKLKLLKAADQRQELQARNDLFQKRLLDVDVKKANELQPSLMIVNFNTIDTDGKIYGASSFILGVKSRLISVDSMDIIERIIAKNTTKINFTNFIKATTGEIRFVKDFLLSIDQAKIDAKNASKKGMAAMMWKTLENRSIKNNWNRIKRSGNDASAITVLVISQETVNSLMKYHDFDITKIKNAKFVMDTYNLMGIIICDESIEAAKFLYAGNDMWETQAYSYLEKEGKQATDYKKTINLLNKGVF